MLFNTSTFVVFFAVVYGGYLLLRRHHKAQNVWLLVASLYFYGSWDWRFLFLIFASSGIDFFAARKIHGSSNPKTRKRFLVLSIVSNLVILGFFKYFNFFLDGVQELTGLFGLPFARPILEIALPVGISFYTFQAISYVVDVYRGHLEPCRSAIDYGLFIAFFPHLVAGPVQRTQVLLPQVMRPRHIHWDQVNAGLFLLVWGFYKKVVIADNLAPIANQIFDNAAGYQGLDTLLGALAFTFQIYCDFSGYSDIARGLSKLMGFELLVNFKLPYFAINPSDFWLRWHISLSTWLRDYLYIPLGGNRGNALLTYINLSITMLLGGLWHGAAMNFVIWGAYHGALLVVYRAIERHPDHADPWARPGSWWRTPPRIALFFCLTVAGWIIFRSSSVAQMKTMFTHLGFGGATSQTAGFAVRLAWLAGPLVLVQFVQYAKRDLLAPMKLPVWALSGLYAVLLVAMAAFGSRAASQFIYFQF